jgi:hypothetical protein
MWLKPLFARTSKNAKSGLRKWLEVLPYLPGFKNRIVECLYLVTLAGRRRNRVEEDGLTSSTFKTSRRDWDLTGLLGT